MNAKTRSALAALAALLLGAAVLACASGEPWPADLAAVEHPPLDKVEEVARRQIEGPRGRLADLLERGRGDARELADAFGDLGELYHAYELLPAAIACYTNAERLDPGTVVWPYVLGLAEETAGELPEAAASFERALERHPGHGPASLHLGEVLLRLGDARAADPHFRAVLGEEAFAAAAHYGLGRVALSTGEPAAAVEHFEAVLAAQPEAGAVRYPLSQALRRLGREAAAEATLAAPGKGAVSFPDPLRERLDALAVSSAALLRRGNRDLVNGRLDDAEAAYRRAVEVRPENVEAQRALARTLVQRGRLDDALRALEAAVQHAPQAAGLQLDLGNVQLSRGHSEQAARAFEKALALDAGLEDAHFNLANLLAAEGRWQEAAPHLERVVELDPADRRARTLRALARHHLGRSADAEAELRALVDEDPADHAARFALADVLVDGKRLDAAVDVLRGALAVDSAAGDRREVLFRLASLAWKNGRRPESIAYFQQAVDLDPTSSDAVTRLANAHQLNGDRATAITLFARATELDPKNATAWLSEARLRILGGDERGARERLDQAIAVLPDDAPLLDTLARLLAASPDDGLRDGRRALELAQRAYGLAQRLDFAETVAMALAELGRFDEAARWQRGLLQQAAAGGDRATLQRLGLHLRLYESRRPVRFERRPGG